MATEEPPADIEDRHVTADGLTETETAMLRVRELRWKYPGAKEGQIRQQFAISSTRYYQVLNALIEKSAALAFAPVTVHRLRRLRDLRREARTPAPDR